MTKKQFLELLIKSFGLVPTLVKSYRTSSNGGEYAIGTGWEIKAHDKNGDLVIDFATPEGFNDAVTTILETAKEYELDISCVREF